MTDASEGASALQISGGDCLYQEFAVTPGTRYVLQCDAKRAQTQYTRLRLTIMDSSYAGLLNEEMEITSSSYQSFTATLNAPSNGAIGVVTFYSEGTGVFDGCSVIAQSTPPPVNSLLSNNASAHTDAVHHAFAQTRLCACVALKG